MAAFFAFLPLHAGDSGWMAPGCRSRIYALVVVVLRIVFAELPDRIGAARLSGGALAVAAVGLAILGLVPSSVGRPRRDRWSSRRASHS